jgi:hypothetical protein
MVAPPELYRTAIIEKPARRGHTHPMPSAPKSDLQMSEDLVVLIKRAERAAAQARELMAENDRWRECAIRQLEQMFELGAEFRASGKKINYPRAERSSDSR